MQLEGTPGNPHMLDNLGRSHSLRTRPPPLTSTGCITKLRNDMKAVDDVAKKATKQLKIQQKKQGGLLDDESGGVAPKAYNVILQLADASGTSAPATDLNPNDVPSWRTKMCNNRITILQHEKRKLEGKSQAVEEEIRKKTALKHRAAADLSWKKKEIAFVGNTITDFRKELSEREVLASETARGGRSAMLGETRRIGEEMRGAQSAREEGIVAVAAFDQAERTRRNQEEARAQTLTLTALFDGMARDKTASGARRRHQRERNTETVKAVAAAELGRVQGLNATVKREQALSAARLRDKRAAVRDAQTAAYLADRTAQFNEFKRAAAETAAMQGQAAGIVEELRSKYEGNRALQRTLARV